MNRRNDEVMDMFGFQMTRAVLLAALLLTTAALPAAAQPTATLAGTVVTPTGETVTDGVVRLVDVRRRVALDEDGRFRFENLPAGTYLVEVVSPSFGSGVERVVVAAGETTEARVVIDRTTVSDSVVVTASPDARSQLEVAQPTSVLDGEELELRLQASLGETLNEQPGINSTYFGPGASRPIIRGLGGDRVRILDGGIGVGDASNTSPDHAVAADPLGAERIEVVRGPATLLYGSSAVGGVVNVLDGRIPSYVPEASLAGTVELIGGTVADERTGALALEGGSGHWAWHLGGMRRETDDYDTPEGLLENSALETDGANLGVSYVNGRGFLGVSVSGYDTLYGVPGGHGHEEEDGHEEEGEEHEEGEEEEVVRVDLQQRRVDLKGELATDLPGVRGVKLRLGVADYEHTELEGEETGTFFTNDSIEGRLELIQARRGSLSGSFGLQWLESDFEAVGEEAFVPPSQTTSWALFAFEELTIDDATRFQFGARYETQDVEPGPDFLPARSFDGLSGSLGLLRDLGESYAVAVNVAHTERAPSATELYADGPHVATNTFELGDPDLGLETSLGVDLSLRKREGRLTGVFNVFTNRFDDYVFERFTGLEEEGLDVVRFVQEDAVFTGAELDLVVALARMDDGHVDLLLSGDYVDAELDDTGEPLPRVPPLRYGVGVNVHQGPWRASAEVRRVQEQDDVSFAETPTDGFTLVNASVSYRLFVGDMIADLLLRGTNLTDEEARIHSSFLKDEAPLPGRDLSLALRLRF
jgi:iron complex outermembrane recepter protein